MLNSFQTVSHNVCLMGENESHLAELRACGLERQHPALSGVITH